MTNYLENIDWGYIEGNTKKLFEEEFSNGSIYEKFNEVKEGDIVVDVGSSIGVFAKTILQKKPKHIFCIEPSKNLFPTLVKNTIGYPVTQINKFVAYDNSYSKQNDNVYYNDDYFVENIKFSTFLNLYGINKINFLKLDCEGGEYSIFNDDNIEFLLKNVDYIVGEWHFYTKEEKNLFKNFRDKYLIRFKNYKVYSHDMVDITWSLFFDEPYDSINQKGLQPFIEYYYTVIIYIDNR